ncbi:MAG: MFS transporter [Candidatus Aminicenantes bacterium]|nr:MFS transporter [Candidatus Aminicenantes bacterium]
MNSGRAHRLLRRVVDIQPGETRTTLLLFVYFFLMMAAAYVILPLKTSLFLKKLTPENLPLAYLATAVLMSFVAAFNTRLLQTLNRKRYISLSLLFFTAGLPVFRVLFRTGQTWVSMVFWFWAEVFLAISVIQFWILVNDIYTPRQAKRFIGFFVSGGLLGGVAGSLAASVLSGLIGSEELLLVCPFFLLAGLGIILVLPPNPGEIRPEKEIRKEGAPKSRVGYLQSLRILMKSRYLLLLSGVMLVGFAVSKFIDFQFSHALHDRFTDDERTAFLGVFYTLLLVASYLLHILLTNRILREFGLRAALFISPVVLAVGAAFGFFIPAEAVKTMMVWTSLMRGADKSLSHSLSQSTREILYIPVPVETKYKAKVFIDLFINKFADAMAALFLLVFFNLLHFSLPQLSVLTLAFLLVWAYLNHQISREYVGIVKKNLTIKWPDADKFVFEQIDVDATKLVFDTLESRQRSSVLYAMNLMDLIKKDQLSPELKKIITAKSSEVLAGSFDSLLDVSGEALVPEWEDVIEEQDLDAQVREILSLDVYQELMRERVEKIAEARDGDAVVSQMEIAKALGMMTSDSPLVQNLGRLLKHDSPEVVRYALESAGRQKKREFVPHVVPHLGRPATQQAAGQALLEYGDKIGGTLKDYLSDPKEDVKLRKAIPDILARMGTQRATDLLVRELKKRDSDVQGEVIEALTKIRSQSPFLRFSERDIDSEVFMAVKKACILVLELFSAQKENKKAVLAGELENILARTLKQIFELASLVYPHEDVMRAYQNYREGTKRSVDYALELLENMLKKDIKEALLPLLEDRPLDEKAQTCRKILKALEKRAFMI